VWRDNRFSYLKAYWFCSACAGAVYSEIFYGHGNCWKIDGIFYAEDVAFGDMGTS
jgi:hypothetical protein